MSRQAPRINRGSHPRRLALHHARPSWCSACSWPSRSLMALWVSVSDWTRRRQPALRRRRLRRARQLPRRSSTGGTLARSATSAPPCATTSTTCCSWCRCRPRWRWRSRCWSTRRRCSGRGFFRTAFYFPLGDQLGGDHGAVAVPLQHHRCRQRDPRLGRDQRPQLVPGPARPRAPRPRRRRRRHGSGRPHRRTTASASAGGSGSPGRRSRCSRCVLLAVFTTSGTFMLLFIAALNNIGDEIEEAGDDRRRQRLAAVPPPDPADAPAHPVHGAHPGPDRHLAGLRPDLHRHPGRARRRPR